VYKAKKPVPDAIGYAFLLSFWLIIPLIRNFHPLLFYIDEKQQAVFYTDFLAFVIFNKKY